MFAAVFCVLVDHYPAFPAAAVFWLVACGSCPTTAARARPA